VAGEPSKALQYTAGLSLVSPASLIPDLLTKYWKPVVIDGSWHAQIANQPPTDDAALPNPLITQPLPSASDVEVGRLLYSDEEGLLRRLKNQVLDLIADTTLQVGENDRIALARFISRAE